MVRIMVVREVNLTDFLVYNIQTKKMGGFLHDELYNLSKPVELINNPSDLLKYAEHLRYKLNNNQIKNLKRKFKNNSDIEKYLSQYFGFKIFFDNPSDIHSFLISDIQKMLDIFGSKEFDNKFKKIK